MLPMRGGINLKEYGQAALAADDWTPELAFDNMLLWLRPDADVTFQDVGRTTPIVNGANALGITDKSPNENHMSQAAGPVWVASEPEVGGYPVLRFNGTSHYLNYAKTIIAGGMTVAAVAKMINTSTQETIISETDASNNRYTMGGYSTSFESRFYNGAAWLTGTNGAATRELTQFHIWTAVKDVTRCDFYLDGTLGTIAAASAVHPTPHREIGNDNGYNQFFERDLVELICWGTAQGVDILANLMGYFSKRYGITVS